MKFDYKQTKSYWNNIFKNHKENLDMIINPIPFKEIEDGLKWISEASSVLDFGCGNGTLLLRSIFLGSERVTGIDISEESIRSANEKAKMIKKSEACTFIYGGIEKYLELDNRYDSIILSNIIDNLLPQDCMKVIEKTKKLLSSNGKIFLKLNDYKSEEELMSSGLKKIENDLFLETEGIYLFNISNHFIRKNFHHGYTIIKNQDISLMGTINRLFLIQKN